MNNVLTQTLTFFHDSQRLSAEVEYIVDINPDHDGAKIIGELTNDLGEVFEVKDKLLAAEFRAQLWDEIEDLRRELVWDKSSRLRDFNKGGVYRMPLPEEGIVT